MESQHDKPAPAVPAIRASDQERDQAVQRLQTAFAEGRLDDREFDERMRTALAARTRADLEPLFADLPGAPAGAMSPAAVPAARAATVAARAAEEPAPGRRQIAYKSHVRRSGRWRVPHTYTSAIYKGGGVLDLRAAELESPVTTIRAVAYKSTIEIIVPPGVRVEMAGVGVSSELDDASGPEVAVIHVRGFAYKGMIVARTMPSARALS
ncbi:MAG TPA: DUF1707 domain-containing protein [Streptosporangiaceae bacterium]|nr:DUF1707 domain-containing protein [Streptosporangiaceae bacterium]